jgi:hypothetical protein
MRFSNLRVGQATVGEVNIGHLQVIDLAVSHIQHAGDLLLSHALWEFTQMVLESREVESAARREMIEQLGFLADQVITRGAQKRHDAARAALADLDTIVAGIPSLTPSWATLHPLLQGALA